MIERFISRHAKHGADMPHALAIEDTLANVRVALMVVSCGATLLDPQHRYGATVVGVLAVLALYSVGVLVALRSGRIRTMRQIALVHVVDTGGAIVATTLTGGTLSPFSTLFLFVLLAAGYRWGGLEVWLTCGVSVAALGAESLTARLLAWNPPGTEHIVGLRLAYLGLGGVLVGYMAEAHRRQRARAQTAAHLLSLVRSESSIVTAVQVLGDELLAQFSASRILLLVEEDGRELVTAWRAERRDGRSGRSAIQLTQGDRSLYEAYLFPVPPSVTAWVATRAPAKPGADGGSVIAVGADGSPVSHRVPLDRLYQAPDPWSRLMGLVYRPAIQTLQARVFLFLLPSARATRRELRDLQVVMREVSPAIFNLYLQRRLQSRSGVVERARISKELHDGVIQSLIGVEMQLEVMRRESAGTIPGALTAELARIQGLLSQEVLNVRDLMQLLKPSDVDARRLVEHLAATVEQFRHRTGIQARFACDVEDVDLPPRQCREIAGIVQEALANIRKHSGATAALVRLGEVNGSWQLIVDDNGRGFDFDGYLTPADLDAQRKGPVMIKERARAIDGRLAIQSHPGFGARLEITIPGRRHA
jgi:signal transduction histidine kinase